MGKQGQQWLLDGSVCELAFVIGNPLGKLQAHADRADRLRRGALTRRDFLWLTVAGAAASLYGCATSPVTGERILVGLSESDEVATDKRVAIHQFSSDYGAVQDERVNRYVAEVGRSLDVRSHRPQMPYS